MRRIILAFVLFAMCALAHAQNVAVHSVVTWVNPTHDTGGGELTGVNALSHSELFVATAHIPDLPGGAPQANFAATATTGTYDTTVAGGSTIYYRMRSCTAHGCSALTAEVAHLIQGTPQPPLPPTDFGVGVTVSVIVNINTTPKAPATKKK